MGEEALVGRLDLREFNIFTVDGRDAKDFDDAIHIQPTPEGTFVVGVHIADVSHYVTEGSPLDKEAYARATSVYLPGFCTFAGTTRRTSVAPVPTFRRHV